MSLAPELYNRTSAPPELQAAAAEYERRYGIRFETVTYFSTNLLAELHRPEDGVDWLPDNVIVASQVDHTILDDMALLSDIANRGKLTLQDRANYEDALLRIYRKLPIRAESQCMSEQTLCVGVRREGEQIARELGFLSPGRSFCPDAKRIHYLAGLAVGMSEVPELKSFQRCVIIDGAVASGGTTMTIMENLQHITSEFYLYSVHGPCEGLRAISRYARLRNLKLTVVVGHATAGLNSHYYAIDPKDPSRVVLGDVGDTITRASEA